jgi:hypothetical protein
MATHDPNRRVLRHDGAGRRRAARHAYFVGRRPFEAAEVYSVTAKDVERLRPERRYGGVELDWRGGDTALLELSHVLLSRVTEEDPPVRLEAWFAVGVLARLPDQGFVLDSDELRKWIRLVGEEDDSTQAQTPPRRCLTARLLSLFLGAERR